MIGALIGGMIGAATALFMAPKTGKELRNDFNEQARNISEKNRKIKTNGDGKKVQSLLILQKKKTSSVTEIVTNKSSNIVNKVKSLKTGKRKRRRC
ncbi:YtxH domain-containing protein [Peribacillus frigoritolerans]|nr:YtxH domain-containing protein [Peribacillus frigoritolerans]